MSATVVRPISTFNPVQSASHTTNTPSLPERQTTLSPRSPGHSVGASLPVAINMAERAARISAGATLTTRIPVSCRSCEH